MKHTCTIKSHPKGITLVLDPYTEFESLIFDICEVFNETRDFFGEGELMLSTEGRALSSQELLVIIEAIELNSNIKIPLILDDGEVSDVRMIGLHDRFYFDRVDTNAKIIRGNVEAGETVVSDTGLLIVGDIKKGGTAVAAGSVTVIGGLYGEVRAGEPDFDSAFVTCGKLGVDTVTIGGKKGNINVTYRGLLQKKLNAKEPVVIRLLHGYFHAEPMSSGLVSQD